jgi:hypothetical protein
MISRPQRRKSDMTSGIAFLLSALLLIFASGLGAETTNRCVDGEGPVKKETRALPRYENIILDGAFDVFIDFNEKDGAAILEAQGNLLPLIDTTVESNTLTVKTRKSVCTSMTLKITLHPGSLKTLVLDGAEDVELRDIAGQAAAFTINGSGGIRGNGRLDRASIDINGSGTVRMKSVRTAEVAVRITGTGDVEVSADKTLDVQIDGAGDVAYFGNPQVKQEIEGAGTVRQADK